MRKCDIRSEADLICYLTDCTLATVESMAMIKSRKVGEYERQKSIAQFAIDKGRELGVVFDSRAAKVIEGDGSVDSYVKAFQV